MAASRPASAQPVPSAPGSPPSTSRQRRSRSSRRRSIVRAPPGLSTCSGCAVASVGPAVRCGPSAGACLGSLDRRRVPSSSGYGGSTASARAASRPGPNPGRPRPPGAGRGHRWPAPHQLAQGAPHARLVRGERPPQQRQHVGERLRATRSSASRRPGRAAARRGPAACRRPRRRTPRSSAAASAGPVPGRQRQAHQPGRLLRSRAARRRAAAAPRAPRSSPEHRPARRRAACPSLRRSYARTERSARPRPLARPGPARSGVRRGGRSRAWTASRWVRISAAPSASRAGAGGRQADADALGETRRDLGESGGRRCRARRRSAGADEGGQGLRRGGRRPCRARPGRRARASPPAARPAVRPAGSARRAR